MAFFDNIRNAIHPYDDEYMENEESAAEEEFEQERAPEEESYEPPRPAFSRRENRAAPTPPPPAPEKQKTKLQLAKPSSYDEAAGIADSLKQRQAILMNLENMTKIYARGDSRIQLKVIPMRRIILLMPVQRLQKWCGRQASRNLFSNGQQAKKAAVQNFWQMKKRRFQINRIIGYLTQQNIRSAAKPGSLF